MKKQILISAVSIFILAQVCPAQSAKPKTKTYPDTFGPEIERTLSSESRDCILDLDTNKTWGPPARGTPEDYPGADVWADFFSPPVDHNVYAALGHQLIALRTDEQAWEIKPADLVKQLEKKPEARPLLPVLATEKDKPPITYLFRTRKGGIGVLQILGFTDKPQGVNIRYKMVQKEAGTSKELWPGVLAQRDWLLAQADKKIRKGLIKLAKKFPQLKKARDWGHVTSQKSDTGRVGIWLFHVNKGKAKTVRGPLPKNERFTVLVVVQSPPPEPVQLAMFPKYPNLGLVGQVNATAGDSKLQTALKKLVADSLIPLERLENKQEKIRLYYQKRPLKISVELFSSKGCTVYQQGESIFVEARLKNTSDETQVYPRGFGMTSMQWCCQVELITPDGKAWAAEAVPFQQFDNYKDIVLEPGQTVTIGKWDISQLQYNPGHVFLTMGDRGRTAFSSFAEPGKYSVRWWDGVFQGRRPLVSPELEFELIGSKL